MENTVIKKTLAVAVLSIASLGSASLQAAEAQNYSIDLQANIPAENFYVLPVESGWINQVQDMNYDIITKRIQPLQKSFQFKNTSGGIQATLTNTDSTGKALLSNGATTIPLAVTFNDVALNNTPQAVVTAAAAKDGGRATLRIAQESSAALTATGLFTGQVAMVFEPVITPPNP